MLKAKERILEILAADKIAICDDCLSKLAQVTPRQQVNQICRPLSDAKTIERFSGKCEKCGKPKLINKRLIAASISPKKPTVAVASDLDKRINDIHYELEQLLRKIKALPRGTSLNDYIHQLSRDGYIPNHIATLMHAVRRLRNDFAKERVNFTIAVVAALEASWVAIQEWAQK